MSATKSEASKLEASSSAEILIKLCRQRQWQAIIRHVRANPSDVKATVASKGNLSPLHIVCELGPPIQVIKALLSADPSAAQTKGGLNSRLSLHCLLASATKYPLSEPMVTAIVEAFPGACRITDAKGNLPVHFLCQASAASDNIFTTILAMYPEGAYARNLAGMYPLHLAAANTDLVTKNIALAALDRGTLYANISKMTSNRLAKEHEVHMNSLEKSQGERLSKMETKAKEDRSKLKKDIDALKLQLKEEKDGNLNLQEEMKVMGVQHEEKVVLAVQKEQTKASVMEQELRLELAGVQLKNMDFLDQIELTQEELGASNDEVAKQAEKIEGLEHKLGDTFKALEEANMKFMITNQELTKTQTELTSIKASNVEKSTYILHLEASLQNARKSALSLAQEQERMNTATSLQREAMAALLLGHDTAINDAASMSLKMLGVASAIGKATRINKKDEDANCDVAVAANRKVAVAVGEEKKEE